MSLPPAIAALWDDLSAVRHDLLREIEGLSQRHVDWRPGEREWSIGEVLDHLTIAENATGKLTTKLTREAAAAGTLAPYPSDLTTVGPLPPWPPGPTEAPAGVWPEGGKAMDVLIGTMKATRERSRQSIDRLATVDPRPLRFPHPRLGMLDLGQWWRLQAEHDRIHLQQIRDIKRTPGFPA